MSDLISRSDLLRMIEKDIDVTIVFFNDSEKYSTNNNFDELYGQLKTLQGYREVIKHLPTVEPVVKGEWIGNTCSACNLEWNENMVNNADDWGYFDPMPNFCPNCGADMRKKVE